LPCELPRYKKQDKITTGRLSLSLVNLSDCPTERSRSGARQEGKPLIFNSMMSLLRRILSKGRCAWKNGGKKTTMRPGHGLLDHIKQRR